MSVSMYVCMYDVICYFIQGGGVILIIAGLLAVTTSRMKMKPKVEPKHSSTEMVDIIKDEIDDNNNDDDD